MCFFTVNSSNAILIGDKAKLTQKGKKHLNKRN